jgi:hypothetical protein
LPVFPVWLQSGIDVSFLRLMNFYGLEVRSAVSHSELTIVAAKNNRGTASGITLLRPQFRVVGEKSR